MLNIPTWAEALQPASFRGIEFEVLESQDSHGRRLVTHEYPFRDTPYVEDLGLGKQEIRFTGFLVGDDVYDQRDAFIEQVNIPGVGTLVHPSLGSLQAVLTSASFGEKFDAGRVVAVELSFIVSDPIQFSQLYPLLGQSSLTSNPLVALNVVGAAIADFVSDVADALAFINVIASVVGSIAEFAGVVADTISAFADLVDAAANIALAPISAVRGITLGQPNLSLGRYAQGNLAAPTNALGVVPISASAILASAVTNALATACTSRAAVASAVVHNAALAKAGDPAFPQSVADLVEAARTVIRDPSDQIQALIPLCNFTPINNLPPISPISQSIAAVTTATGALCRRAAIASLANACAVYKPTSSTQVQNIVSQITPVFDSEITASADVGDLTSYQELRNLKTVVVSNLQASAKNLPALMTVKSQKSLPSLVWAYRLYGDTSRTNELVQQVDPDNPAFMPLSFQALSA